MIVFVAACRFLGMEDCKLSFIAFSQLCPHATFYSSINFCSLSTFLGGCAARIHATSFCYSS
jgi:hypothetical protein